MAQLLSEFLNTAFSTYTDNDAFNNSVIYPITLSHTTTGTPATGIGTGLKFITETSNGNNEIGGLIDVVTTDVTSGSEDFDFVFKNMAAGSAAAETLRITSAGNLTVANNLTVSGDTVILTATSSRDKYRLWNDSTYTVGLQNSVTYGAINNDKAITFQVGNSNNQGFWWGDTAHTTAQGAMALSTDGKLTVADSVRIGYGESDTTIPGATFELDVNGSISANNIDFGNVDIGAYTGFESWNHNGNSFDASSDSTYIGDIFVIPAAGAVYLTSLSQGYIYKYYYTVSPNISTLTYNELLDTNSEDSQISGIFIKSDGTEIYVSGVDNAYIYQYSLSSANNLGTATFNQSFDVSSEDTYPTGVSFNTDGTKMIVLGQTNNKVFSYNLSSGWDISTAVYASQLNLASYTSSPTSMRFSSDGSLLYILDKRHDGIFKFSLSTAFDITSATFDGELDISTIGETQTLTKPTGMFVYESENRLYVVDNDSTYIHEYNTNAQAAKLSGNKLIVQNDIHVRGDAIVYHNANIHGRLQALNATFEGDINLTGNIVTNPTFIISAAGTSVQIGATSGNTTIRNDLSVSGTSALASAKVSDLTETRLVFAGVDGLLSDDVGLTWDGSTLALVGDITADNIILTADLNVGGDLAVTGSIFGNADTASAWANTRTVTFATGDVTGSFSIDGSSDVSNVVLTIAANSVALGTDTTGNYMAGVSAGSGITITHTPGEGSTATISHADTSSVTDVTLAANTFVDEITFDTFGHVQTIGTTAVNFNVSGNYAFKSITDGTNTAIADSNTDTFKIRNGQQITVTVTNDDATHGDSVLIGHANSGVSANTYGSTSAIPVIAIDAQGHITSASTASISTSWTVSDGSNTQIIAGGDTLTVTGGTLLTSVVSATDTLTINHDSVSRTNTTSTASPTHGGTFTVVDSVTSSTEGHVTAINVKTVTLPSDNNTTYAISAETSGKLRLTGSNATTDDVTFVGAGIASVSTTDANTITITATEADTLSSVTGRGATTASAISITNTTASSGTGTGALVVTGGVGVGGALNVGGNATITGNLTVNGTTTTVNSTTVTLDDPIMTLGGDTAPSTDDNKDRGIEFRWHNGTSAKVGFFGFDDSTGKFTFIPDGTNTSEVFSGTKGTIDANIDWSNILNVPTYDNYSSWTLSDGSTTQTISSGNTVTVTGGTLLTSVVSATDTVTINHDSVSRTNTTSTASPTHGGTFTVVDSVTSSTEGHVTAINVKTVTLPSDNNTTYTVSTEAGGDAYSEVIRLTGSDASTDNVTLAVSAVDTVYGLTISESGDTITFAHANTSSAANLSASGRTYVTSLTFDTYGHVTAYGTATENVTDTNTTYAISAETATGGVNLRLTGSDTTTDDVKFSQGSNITLTRTDANTITISSTDTNTTYSAGTGLSLSGTTFNHSNSVTASTASEGGITRTLAYGGTFNVPSVTYDAQGHITAKGSVTLTLPASDNTNTTYSQSAVTTSGGAFLRLTGSDTSTDDVKFASGTAVTVGYTDANTITIDHTDTSSVTDVTSGTNSFVTAQTYDTYGHVLTTAKASVDFNVSDNYAFKTITVSDTDSGSWSTTGSAVADSNADTLTLVSGTGIDIDVDTTNDRIRITNTVTDTNTTYDYATAASSTGNSVDLVLTGNDATSDIVTVTGGSNVTITRDSATQFTITSTDTDTHYTSKNIVGASSTATANATATNGNVYINHLEQSTVTSFHKISGAGATSVTSASGNITITSTDTNTTYTAGTGLTLSGTTINANTDATIQSVAADTVSATASRTYAIQVDASNNLVVNVPWIDTNTNTDVLQSISNDTTTASAHYISFVAATSGAQAGKVSSTKLTFTPSTGNMTLGGDLTVSGGDITAGNVASTLFAGNTTFNTTWGGGLTSGALTIGGTATTGTITIDPSTGAHTLNIGTGANTTGTKTVNIATESTTSGITALTLGSSNSTSSTVINAGSGKVRFNIGATTLYLPTADGSEGQVLKTDGSGNLSFDSVDSLSGGIANIVEDTSPQLGGDLDVNGRSIVSASGGNILITPDTTGYIQLDGLKWPTADGSNGYLLSTDGAGQLSWTSAGSNTTYTVSVPSNGVIRLTGSDSSTDDVTIAGGTDISLASASDTITVTNSSTLSTVTGRGATTASAISITNATAATNTSTGALKITGGVGIGGALYVGGNEIITGDLTVSGGDITAGNVASTLFAGNTTTATTWGGALTSGALTIGGTATTGTITFDRSASAHTVNYSTGANASTVTKTINFGTGGQSGSTTAINIGSSISGATTNVNLYGNLTVTGTTTYVNTTTLNVGDNIITLNADVTATPSEDAGIEIARGTSANVQLIWNETTDRWSFTNDGSTFYNIPLSTEYDNYGDWTLYMDGTSRGTVSSGEIVDFVSANTGSTAGISLAYSTTNNNRISIAHADTSTLSGAQGSAGIASITVDEMGHVTAVTTATYLTSQANNFATVAITHTDSGYTWGVAGTNTNQTADSATDTITIVRGLTGSTAGIDLYANTVAGTDAIKIAHADTSTLSGAQGSAGIASITVDEMGHVTAVTTATYLTAESDTLQTVTARGATSTNQIILTQSDAGTNTVLYPLVLARETTGTPANNIGTGIQFVTETTAGNNEIGATIEAVVSDVTATSEDFSLVFKTMAAGAAASTALTLTSTGSATLVGDLTVSGGDITAGNVASTLFGGNTTTATTWGGALTSGALTIGGTATTGTITFDRSASAHTVNYSTGANASAVTKTINFGTGGAAGSTTNITVGSANGGTLTVNSPNTTFNQPAAGVFRVAATGAPTTDMAQFTNTGFPVVTAGVNALSVTYVGGASAAGIEASAMRIDLTPGGTPTAGADVWSGLRLTQGAATSTGVTVNVLKADAITAGAGTDNVLYVGTGYDSIVNYNGTTVINGTGQVVAAQIATGTATGLNITGNASTATTATTATTLQTARTLWGQSFNGSANISGNLTSVGSITGTTTLVLNSTTTNAITVDSTTTGAVNIGNNANAKTITIGNTTGATGIVLNSGSAGVTANMVAAGVYKIQATAAPTTDMVQITNTGQANITAGVNAFAVTYVGGAAAVEASAMRIDLTPGSLTGGTWSGLRLTQSAATATGVAVNVIKADSITAGAGTDNVLYVGSGYDSIVNYNGTPIIAGDGSYFRSTSLGSISNPVFSFTGDSNTGIYSSAADTLNITTGGTLAVTVASNGNVTVVGDLTVSGGDITAGNVASTLFGGNTTTATTWGGALTSGALTIGGTATTGTITFDRSASAHTVNYSTGANASAVTKTINFGTGGASGSTTNITVGSNGGGTLTVNSPNTTFNQPAAGVFRVAATGAPTTDMAVFTNVGQAVTTAGVNALNVTYVGGAAAVEASAMRIDLTPGGTSGGTWSGLRLTQGAVTATGVAVNVIKADTITAGAGTDNVLYVGTGYDSIINYNGTPIIDGTGAIKKSPVVTVTLTGDVTGTANTTLTDLASGTVSVATTIAANSVALGTDTTGNYVASVASGTDISVAGTAGEGWTATVNNTSTLSTVTGRGATTATAISITNTTASTSTSTGALKVSGGVGIGGTLYVGGNEIINGDLTVSSGTTRTNAIYTNGLYNGGLSYSQGPILTYTLTSGGSGYTDGTYINQVLSGGGVYATFDFTVVGGIVTVATLTERGSGFAVSNTIAIPALGTTGSGGLITVDTVRTVDVSLYNSAARIRLSSNDTSLVANQEIGGIYFGTRDASVGGAGDKAYILGTAEGTSGGGKIEFWTSANGGSPTLCAAVGGANDFRLYNTAGTFYHSFSNAPTANRTLTLPDTTGTIALTSSSITGNATTATTLQTARTIGMSGVTATATSFNGSANITIPVTAVPATLLTGIIADARISGAYTGMTNLTGSGTVDFAKFLGNAADSITAPSFSWTGDTNTGMYQPAADQVGFTTGGVSRAVVSATGLSVTGAITATGDVTAYAASDSRLKTNIEPIANALSKVDQLNGVTYNWNELAKEIEDKDTEIREVGIIAQDVNEVLPEVVTTRDNGYMAVRYEKLVPLLIEAIKELNAKVADLERKLDN